MLTEPQKKILYDFAILQKNNSDADGFWLRNKNQFPPLNDTIRNKMAEEIFANSHLLYAPAKKSSVQLWMQTQSLTNWMLYLAAFIAICSIIALMRNYWNSLIDILIRQFAPLFRFLFSAVLLTYELLFIGLLCIAGGCMVHEMVLRTVMIHVGFFLLWSQSTAIFTGEYLVKKYVFKIKDNFWKDDKWEAIKTICFPAVLLTLAILYVIYKVPEDTFYYYEIVISTLTFVYALPFWRYLEKYICLILIPFKDEKLERSFRSIAAGTILALIIDVVLVGQSNILFSYLITALTTLLIMAFLVLSLKENYRNNYKNYYYLQIVVAVFFAIVLFYSFDVRSPELIWVSIIGASIFILIKYWEIPSFFINWKKSNYTWGFLGMAVLLWLLAKGILFVSQELYLK